jgi:hypothetical protein
LLCPLFGRPGTTTLMSITTSNDEKWQLKLELQTARQRGTHDRSVIQSCTSMCFVHNI